MIADYFRLVLRTFLNRRLRSLLTIIGIIIGTTAIISLISIGQGMQSAVQDVFYTIGTDKLFLFAGGTSLGPAGASLTNAKLTQKDIDKVLTVNGVELAVPIVVKSAKVKFGGVTKYISVMGTPVDQQAQELFKSVDFYQVDEGRAIKNGDTYKANMGHTAAETAFDRKVGVGSSVEIQGKKIEVIGLIKRSGSPIHDRLIRMPLDSARQVLNEPDLISMVMIKLNKGEDPVVVSEKIKDVLRRSRDVKVGEEDFNVQVPQQLAQQFGIILAAVNIFLSGIASISIVVGALGITNTMFTSVVERTKEIGIMKSIGATNGQIATLFLFEAGFLGLLGGLCGVILGFLVGKGVDLIAVANGITILKSQVSIYLIVFSLLGSFTVGALAGLLPAVQASKLRPVEAISHE